MNYVFVPRYQAISYFGNFVSNHVIDMDLDGQFEFAYVYTDMLEDNANRSAVVCSRNLGSGSVNFQYNGWLQFAKCWTVYTDDVLFGPGEDIIVACQKKDSVTLEIIGLDSVGEQAADTLLVALGRKPWFKGGWQNLHVYALAGIDLNNDGHRDIIYSASGKPDSAFERGITAYDVVNDSILWFFKTADAVSPEDFSIISNQYGSRYLIVCCGASMNAYSANDMDSRHAYLLGLDINGNELWRHCLGGPAFLYPDLEFVDINGDGTEEVIAPFYAQADSIFELAYCAVDVITGEKLACTETMFGGPMSIEKISHEGITPFMLVLAREEDKGVIYKLNLSLRRETIYETPYFSILDVADYVGDSLPEIVFGLKGKGLALADINLEPLAFSDEVFGEYARYTYHGRNEMYFNRYKEGHAAYYLMKQSFWSIVFARYKWWLAVGISLLVVFIIVLFARWVRSIYLASTGLPTLKAIKAAVLVFDSKMRMVFANNNDLTEALAGQNAKRGKSLNETRLNSFPELCEVIEKSYEEPYLPLQARIETSSEGRKYILDVFIYPHLDDRHNTFIGKIVVLEDAGERADWERKVILGEAAQKWLHRLKGNMATTRITIENLFEDPQLVNIIGDNQKLKKYLTSIRERVIETSQHSEKILRFVRIPKPQRVDSDINGIINNVVELYGRTFNGKIEVVKMLQSSLPKAFIDPDQMTEVIDNLVANAQVATSNKGIIKVKTGLAENLHRNESEKYIEIQIEDNGCGIAPDDLSNIFKPGFTKSGKGTGLGLAIVKEIVDNHDGAIDVRSNRGEGTCFTIKIPLQGDKHG